MPINRRRIGCGLERAARTVLQHQACLRLFVVNGIATRLDEAQQSRRLNRLTGDLEIAGLQAMNQRRQISVAQPLIVGSRERKSHSRACPRLDLESQVGNSAMDKQ